MGMNVKELTHSQQQQPQAPKFSQKGINGEVDYQNNNALAPQRSLLYRLKDSIQVKYKTHTKQSTSSTQKRLRLVNLIENAQRQFQGSLFSCYEYVPYTALATLETRCTLLQYFSPLKN